MELCPCGSTLAYEACCQPLITGERKASTAEEVMRSRYSAYVRKELEYIYTSLHPDSRSDYDAKTTRAWAERAVWHAFKVLSTAGGGPEDTEGTVEFVATYSENGVSQEHHELSTFKKHEDTWYFLNGTTVPPRQVVRSAPKTGRNDPCICGSGKKYKKCCG